ncbi:hypothetical protein H4J58_05065 [Colwellia sp. MB3u-70]|uniref:hypothetical protein n=1 Tax=unclassified Colwellia TaxID=196834 RepID=UPI0015F5B948|nr:MULTISPECIES: hypothetical protein [unclassified Colwellia]MBA6292905.1 hypothetical protein [Colwellia sp. MB3u-8]MBA6306486.1 hypothetical protein [Colwellia sp. MB3u-70]
MKGQIKNMRLILVILLSLLFLQACGGSNDTTPTFTISSSVSSVAFTHEFLQAQNHTIALDVTFDGDGLLLGFAPTAAPVSWLNYRIANLTATSATIHIDVVNADIIPADLYGTTLRLSSGDTATTNFAHADINVSLLIWQALTYDDTYGVDAIASQNIALSSSADNLTLASSVSWLSLEKSFLDGVTTITATPDVSHFSTAGFYPATIDITSPLGTTEYPVELSLDNIHLFADRATVALAQTANISNSQTTLNINSNSLLPWGWQATTEAAWLTLTPNADTNELTLVADSTALANNATTIAEITLSGNEQTTAISETIQVSFYKSDLLSENNSLNIVANTDGVVTNPLLPQYYVATNNELRSYHLYTNELLSTTVIAPADTLLEQLIIHPDASMMLAKAVETIVIDENTTETSIHRYQINLSDMSVVELTDVDITNEPIKFIRLNGRYFVATTILEFADENLIRVGFDGPNAFFARAFNVAEQNQSLFALDVSTSDDLMSIKRLNVKVNDFGRNPITTEISHSYRPELLGENEQINDFYVTADEQNIYAISPTSEWISFDGTTFIDNGVLNSNAAMTNLALAHSTNDRPHYVRFDSEVGFKIDVYNEQQTLANTIELGANQPAKMLIANGDNRAVLTSSSADSIDVITLSQISSSVETLAFNTTFGNSAITQQTLTLSNISANWQATASAPWLILTPQSDDNGERILIDIDASLITGWGLMTASISIYDPASGTTKVITVDLAIDAIRLSSNYPSLAFNSLATEQTLVHTLDILTNSETNIAWQASTDVSWLSLSTDSTNNTLTITGTPANIASDGVHSAVITLSPTTADTALLGRINVTFNKGVNDANDLDISNISFNTSGLVLDPMRPYVYIAQGDKINTYHVISGALINTTRSPLVDVDLTNLVIHPDGSMLLASNSETYLDENELEQTRINHYQFDLNSYQFSQINSDKITIEYRPLMIKIIAGIPLVITQTLEYADLNLTRQYWLQNNAYFVASIAQANSADIFMAYKQATTSLERFALSYNAYASETISVTNQPAYINAAFTNLSSFAMSHNGETIYSANSTSEWASFDGTIYTDNGRLQGNANVQTFNSTTDSGNNSYFYRFDPTLGITYSKYNAAQVELWSEVIADASAESYLLPAYQRVLIYDAETSTLKLRSHP